MRKIIVPRLSGWLIASVVLFALIGWTSSAQIPVVIYKLSLVSLSAVLDMEIKYDSEIKRNGSASGDY